MIQPDEHAPAANIDVVLKHERDRLRAKRFLHRAIVGPDLLHRGHHPGRKRDDLLPRADDAASDLATETPKIVERLIGRIVRPVDPLHRKPEAVEIPIARNMHRLEVIEQRRATIPRRVDRGIDDVVAIERTHRDELHILDVQSWQKLLKLRPNFLEARLAPTHEVHLVDGDDQMRNPQ